MEELTTKIIAVTTTDENVIKNIKASDYELLGGHSANICYTQKDWEEISQEPFEKTKSRIDGNKENKHHSVFGHGEVSLYIEGIPKILAMLINNEHEYNTSEKSARYTKMHPSEKESLLYEKWIKIFELKINNMYPNEKYLDDKRIHKLAMENARYMISVMTPTKMEYTTSFRQLNYIYGFSNDLLNTDMNNELVNMLKPSLEQFIQSLNGTGLIVNDTLKDYRNRKFSLIVDDNDYPEEFGRSYSTNYKATFAEIAQQQRHRTINYNISIPSINEYYIPEIIKDDDNLVNEWINDISSVGELYPQGLLLNTNETGKYEDFILKLQERLCTCVQLETCMQNKETLKKYINVLKHSDDIRLKKVYDELIKYDKGARCMSGYVCTNPCGFKDGIQLVRKI